MNNPFTSKIYTSVWSKHFNSAKPIIKFEFIKKVEFVKHWLLPLHVNVGKNLTKGINYEINPSANDYKGKTFLIYDVPTYFNVEEFVPNNNSTLRLKKLYQYQGFLMDIASYNNQDDYISTQFSSKNRREFRSNQRRLETCFDISYEFIFGETAKDKFDFVFDEFYNLLTKRFSDKQTNYHHLSATKWDFYKELVFEMLQVKQASLLLICNKNEPIGITLNFHSEDILFETITVFDSDYYKFSIGKTSIIKLLEWCFENKYKISDFSKGDFDYKHKWANLKYDFHYHIYYDKSSIKSVFTANFVKYFFKTKLYLRENNVNEIYRKFVFVLKGKKAQVNEGLNAYKTEKLTDFVLDDNFITIDFNAPEYNYLLQSVYVFLFANPEPIQNITVYKNKTNPKMFVFVGSKAKQKVLFK